MDRDIFLEMDRQEDRCICAVFHRSIDSTTDAEALTGNFGFFASFNVYLLSQQNCPDL
jgi:hypothetical protein